MPIRDSVVDEVRKARDDYARRFDFDFDAMCRDLRQKQETAGVAAVTFSSWPAQTILLSHAVKNR